MPKFRVCVVESREYIVEVEADDEDEAGDRAKDEYAENSTRDQFREVTVDWAEEISC